MPESVHGRGISAAALHEVQTSGTINSFADSNSARQASAEAAGDSIAAHKTHAAAEHDLRETTTGDSAEQTLSSTAANSTCSNQSTPAKPDVTNAPNAASGGQLSSTASPAADPGHMMLSTFASCPSSNSPGASPVPSATPEIATRGHIGTGVMQPEISSNQPTSAEVGSGNLSAKDIAANDAAFAALDFPGNMWDDGGDWDEVAEQAAAADASITPQGDPSEAVTDAAKTAPAADGVAPVLSREARVDHTDSSAAHLDSAAHVSAHAPNDAHMGVHVTDDQLVGAHVPTDDHMADQEGQGAEEVGVGRLDPYGDEAFLANPVEVFHDLREELFETMDRVDSTMVQNKR